MPMLAVRGESSARSLCLSHSILVGLQALAQMGILGKDQGQLGQLAREGGQ